MLSISPFAVCCWNKLTAYQLGSDWQVCYPIIKVQCVLTSLEKLLLNSCTCLTTITLNLQGTRVCRCHCTVFIPGFWKRGADSRVPTGEYSTSVLPTTCMLTHHTFPPPHSWTSSGIVHQPSLQQWKFTADIVQLHGAVFHSTTCIFNRVMTTGLLYMLL